METERVVEFRIVNMDKRPRKRQRLGAHVFLWPGGWEHDNVMPSVALSLDIANRINTFLHGLPNVMPRSDSPPWRKNDKDGNYTFVIGDNLIPRYKIQSKMGEGEGISEFSFYIPYVPVLECWDRESNEMVAIKIVCGVKKYREAAMIEIKMLEKLGKHDDIGGNRRWEKTREWIPAILWRMAKTRVGIYVFNGEFMVCFGLWRGRIRLMVLASVRCESTVRFPSRSHRLCLLW
ncbi:hypothetical protein QQ045_000628 [Rhodiola kirilowii]